MRSRPMSTLPSEPSVRHHSGKVFGLPDPARHLLPGREQAHEALLLIDRPHLLGQVLGVTLSECHHGVDTARLEQLRILAGYAVDAEQVGVVDPCEDLRVPDTTGLPDLLPTLGRGPLLQQRFHRRHASGMQLLRIGISDTRDIDEVRHKHPLTLTRFPAPHAKRSRRHMLDRPGATSTVPGPRTRARKYSVDGPILDFRGFALRRELTRAEYRAQAPSRPPHHKSPQPRHYRHSPPREITKVEDPREYIRQERHAVPARRRTMSAGAIIAIVV